MEMTIVPLKSAVGVMMRLPVLVALGPKVPVAVIVAFDCPPKETVNEPTVLPVTV